MSKNSFRHQTATDREDVARFLNALIDGFERGRLNISSLGHEFSVCPTGLIDFSMEAGKKNGRAKVALNFSWPEEEAELPLLSVEASGNNSPADVKRPRRKHNAK